MIYLKIGKYCRLKERREIYANENLVFKSFDFITILTFEVEF